MKHVSASPRATWALAPLLVACVSRSTPPTPPGAALARAESLYADLRGIRDRIDVSLEAGPTGRNDATPVAALVPGHNALREDLATSLAAVDSTALRGDDARALGIMRRTLARDLGAVSAPTGSPRAAHGDTLRGRSIGGAGEGDGGGDDEGADSHLKRARIRHGTISKKG